VKSSGILNPGNSRLSFFIRAEGFNTPLLGAFSKVLNPECNTLLEQHTPLLAAGLLIAGIHFSMYYKRKAVNNEL